MCRFIFFPFLFLYFVQVECAQPGHSVSNIEVRFWPCLASTVTVLFYIGPVHRDASDLGYALAYSHCRAAFFFVLFCFCFFVLFLFFWGVMFLGFLFGGGGGGGGRGGFI